MASLPPDSPSPPGAVARVALRAAFALVVRQGLVHGLNLLGGILLSRALLPAEFGVYGIVTFILTLCVVLSDVGLGAGLIRQREAPAESDYRSVLAVQHLLVTSLAVALGFAAPALVRLYHLAPADVRIFRLLGLVLPLTAFQVIPSIRLERQLSFGRLALVEVAQALVYNTTVVALVWRGTGLMSFPTALLARGVTGALLAQVASPWRIGWSWDWPLLRRLLAFGVPYQGVAVISQIKDAITPVLIATLLGTAAAGYVNWSLMVAAYPVWVLMAFQRIYLPTFARMAAHPEHLGRFVENVIRMTNALVAPLAVLTLVLIEPITRLVFGARWLAAVPLFRVFWAANLVVPTVTPLMALLNALGLSRVTFGFAALWMVMTWVLGAPGVLALGPMGFAMANLAVQVTGLMLCRVAQKHVRFRILPVVGLVLLSALRIHQPATVLELAGMATAGLLIDAVVIGIMWRGRLARQLPDLFGGQGGAEDLGRD